MQVDTILFFTYSAAYLVLLAWGLTLAAGDRWWTPANVPLLVVAGLVYDNTVLAMGAHIGQGALLEGLNLGRYWVHAVVTPLLVVFAWHVVARTGAGWARSWWATLGAVVAAVALMALELTHVVSIDVEAEHEYGVLSYSSSGTAGGPPLMVLFVTLALLVAGTVMWRRQTWAWLLVGTLLMVVGAAVPIPVNSGAVTNAFELILLTSILATKHFQDRAQAAVAGTATRA